jgi:hypothetical protein
MKGDGFLFMEADIEKLRRDIPHCVEDPESCVTCELWGVSELDKNRECESCARERVLEAERDIKRDQLDQSIEVAAKELRGPMDEMPLSEGE